MSEEKEDAEIRGAVCGMLELAHLALAIGRTPRITRHEDGERFESVAEHTVMLAWCALSLRDLWFQHLDPGEIARFALCHDAPEAICGDTPTLRIDAGGRAAKAEREEEAIKVIAARTCPILPWLVDSIDDYERLKDGGQSMAAKCAAFVRAVDKLMPKLTHNLNGGATLRASGISYQELRDLLERQRGDIRRTLSLQMRLRLVSLQELLSEMTLSLLEEK